MNIETEFRGSARRFAPGRFNAFRPALPRPQRWPRPRGPRHPLLERGGVIQDSAAAAWDGEDIRWLQHCLNRKLSIDLPLGGLITPAVRRAIRRFQQQAGLAATGIADADTRAALRTACADNAATSAVPASFTSEPFEEPTMQESSCGCTKCQHSAAQFTPQAFEYEFGSDEYRVQPTPLNEQQEMELALELLSVTNEAELDQFLGNVFKKVGRFIGKVAKPLGRALKGLAKKALPFLGGALGTLIPVPGVGTALGSALGGALSKALEMEHDGEDREFELSRRFVRIAAEAVRRAAQAPSHVPAELAIRKALLTALRMHGTRTLPARPHAFDRGHGSARSSPRSQFSSYEGEFAAELTREQQQEIGEWLGELDQELSWLTDKLESIKGLPDRLKSIGGDFYHDHLRPPTLLKARTGVGQAAAKIAATLRARLAPPPEKICWLQNVLNKTSGENLVEDGIYGPATRAALQRFQSAHALHTDGIIGPKSETALAQAALNTIAAASVVPINGIMDAATRQQIQSFQASKGLAADGIVGPATRVAMIAALGGRCRSRAATPRPMPPRPPQPPATNCDPDVAENLRRSCSRDYVGCTGSCSFNTLLNALWAAAKKAPELAECAQLLQFRGTPGIAAALACVAARGASDLIAGWDNFSSCLDDCEAKRLACDDRAGRCSQ